MKTKKKIHAKSDSNPLRIKHLQQDNAVVSLEAEELEHDTSEFDRDVLNEMAYRPVEWLAAHYPELVFGHSRDKYATGKHEFKIRRSDGVIYADWRKIENDSGIEIPVIESGDINVNPNKRNR